MKVAKNALYFVLFVVIVGLALFVVVSTMLQVGRAKSGLYSFAIPYFIYNTHSFISLKQNEYSQSDVLLLFIQERHRGYVIDVSWKLLASNGEIKKSKDYIWMPLASFNIFIPSWNGNSPSIAIHKVVEQQSSLQRQRISAKCKTWENFGCIPTILITTLPSNRETPSGAVKLITQGQTSKKETSQYIVGDLIWSYKKNAIIWLPMERCVLE